MSIDWSLAESKPEKGQKVEGRFLLDLRAKVNDLEQQLSENKKELSETQKMLQDTTQTLDKSVTEHNSTSFY